MKVVTKTEITAYPLLSRGKVRDIYAVDDATLLIVTTDRMSAFDVIMSRPIPYKGVILNQITLFWMDMFRDLVPNHIVERDADKFPAALAPWRDELEGRAVLVRRAKPLPIECIVRGYLSGSGWKAYQQTGEVCGHRLPAGLRESDKISPAIFTPSTKAELGQHDENITFDKFVEILCAEGYSADMAETVRELCINLYKDAYQYVAQRGLILMDTKFELGVDRYGTIKFGDELLTPDSSRYMYEIKDVSGRKFKSLDKQIIRDYIAGQKIIGIEHPELTSEVIEATALAYADLTERLTGYTV